MCQRKLLAPGEKGYRSSRRNSPEEANPGGQQALHRVAADSPSPFQGPATELSGHSFLCQGPVMATVGAQMGPSATQQPRMLCNLAWSC